MESVKLNVDGKRQSIELPEAMRFSDDDLCASKFGDAVIIMPRRSIRRLMQQGFDSFTPDVFKDGRVPLASKAAPEIN